eukprot:7390476-Prymnesium_polylepis.1
MSAAYTPSLAYSMVAGTSLPLAISEAVGRRGSSCLGSRWFTGKLSTSHAVKGALCWAPTVAVPARLYALTACAHVDVELTRPHTRKLVRASTVSETCTGWVRDADEMIEVTVTYSVSVYGTALSRCPVASRTSGIDSTSPLAGPDESGRRSQVPSGLIMLQLASIASSPCISSVRFRARNMSTGFASATTTSRETVKRSLIALGEMQPSFSR